ncbi:hypothetical protein BT67DRAFT_217767 [Trichocladium antarcticum]|uniref:Uncharacterized protein n=1 Tax=Trichocladium antarcticum TaxID=1450529 RepID=A0AAN6Z952_9PEZI|nr:hypothetical protein BT67DRAFT_217767 [Trichocladium antarcticum]
MATRARTVSSCVASGPGLWGSKCMAIFAGSVGEGSRFAAQRLSSPPPRPLNTTKRVNQAPGSCLSSSFAGLLSFLLPGFRSTHHASHILLPSCLSQPGLR